MEGGGSETLRRVPGGHVLDFFEDDLKKLGAVVDLPDQLALAVKQAHAATATRDSEVGLNSLARPVHNAAHDRDLDRNLQVAGGLLHLLGECNHVQLVTAAGGTRDEGGAVPAEVERLPELEAGAHLLHRVFRAGNP